MAHVADYDPNIDYYEILQVHPTAHQEVIKRAYRTIVGLLQAHPDLGGSHETAVQVNQAYEVLSNPETRRAYDAARLAATATRPAASAPPPPRAPTAPAPPNGNGKHAPASSRHGTAERRGNGHQGAPGTGQTIICPHCGAHNRLPHAVQPSQAVCGKCGSKLGEKHGPSVPVLPAEHLKLPAVLVAELTTQSELRLQRTHLPANRQLSCLRCGHTWPPAEGEELPKLCPQCHSAEWSDFRLFRCRYCQTQFCSSNLTAWPYWLFPTCPTCLKHDWHHGCERHPLRWLLNGLRGLVKL